jgi:hypothetical protein
MGEDRRWGSATHDSADEGIATLVAWPVVPRGRAAPGPTNEEK